MMRSAMQVIEGGGFRFLTDDPILIAVVRRCAQLEAVLAEVRHHTEVARYRTLRRDVDQIKKSLRQLVIRNEA
jgi:hypothetical protein